MRSRALVLFALCLLLISPALGWVANGTSNTAVYTNTTFASTEYMPYQYEFLLIAIAFVSWFGMQYFRDIEVLLGLVTLGAFGIAAWFAPYLSMMETFALSDPIDNTTTILHAQLITPQPILQVFLIMCFLFALISLAYVTYLRKADEKLENESLYDKTMR